MGMALKTGLSIKLISNLENDRLPAPSPSTRRKLADGYGVSIDQIPTGAQKEPTGEAGSIPSGLSIAPNAR